MPLVFNGRVTIDGQTPTYSGFEITSRIGDVWESYPVTVGADPNKPFEYAHLVVFPPAELDLVGFEVEFRLDGQVRFTTTNWYAVNNEFSGEVCGDCTWTCPILRELDLDFPSLPDPTPTPIPTATNTREPSPSPTSTATPSPSPIAPTLTATATPSSRPLTSNLVPFPPTGIPSPLTNNLEPEDTGRRIERDRAASHNPRIAADRYRCLLRMAILKKVQCRGIS